jgi:Holliday junction resolvasome RuvABC endonuclease subunit
MRIQGAILACLPAHLPVLELAPVEWKRESVGEAMANKGDVTVWAAKQWARDPHSMPQDAFDAYAIAHAARTICDRAAQAAA